MLIEIIKLSYNSCHLDGTSRQCYELGPLFVKALHRRRVEAVSIHLSLRCRAREELLEVGCHMHVVFFPG